MTKTDLKKLIKEVLNEARLTPSESLYPVNIAVKEIADSMKTNPLYRDIKVSYLTDDSEGGSSSVWARVDNRGGSIFVSTVDAPKIDVRISNERDESANRTFNSVDDALTFLNSDPLSVFKSSKNDVLKGATVLSVIDKGDHYGKIITLLTKSGNKITGKFSHI